MRCHDHLALPRVPPQKPLGTAASSPWAYPRRNPLLFHLKPAGRSSVSLGQGFLRQPLRPGLGVFVARFFKALRRFSDAGVDACAGERGCRGLAPDSQPESRELQALRGRCGKVAPSLGEDYPWDGLNTVPSRRPNPQEPCLPASAAARGSRQDPPGRSPAAERWALIPLGCTGPRDCGILRGFKPYWEVGTRSSFAGGG